MRMCPAQKNVPLVPWSSAVVRVVCGWVNLLLMFTVALATESVGGAGVATRIALVSDTHATRGTTEDQPLYRGRLDRVIADVNAAAVDMVLIAGDLTQSGTAEQFDDFKAQVAAFRAPVRCVPGNHDIGGKAIPGQSKGPTAARVARYEEKMGPTFFSRTVAGVRVIGLNTPALGSGLPVERAMWSWLEGELAAPASTPTIALLHYPPFLKTADEPGGGYWNIEPAPRARLLALLKQGGVRLVLAGHVHYALATRDDGLQVIVTLPVSFGLPRGQQPQGWTLVTVRADGEAEHAFRAVKD